MQLRLKRVGRPDSGALHSSALYCPLWDSNPDTLSRPPLVWSKVGVTTRPVCVGSSFRGLHARPGSECRLAPTFPGKDDMSLFSPGESIIPAG